MANATLFVNCATLIYPIYGYLIARAWPTRVQGLALVMALAGGALLMGRSYELSPDNVAGDLLCLVAGALYAAYFVILALVRSEEHTSELQSLMRISYAVFCLTKKIQPTNMAGHIPHHLR